MTKFNLTKIERDDMIAAMESACERFELEAPADYESDKQDESVEIEIEDSRDLFDELEREIDLHWDAADEESYYEDEDEPYDDGQPSEYDEWQDFYGGDDWDHGQYENDCDCMFDN